MPWLNTVQSSLRTNTAADLAVGLVLVVELEAELVAELVDVRPTVAVLELVCVADVLLLLLLKRSCPAFVKFSACTHPIFPVHALNGPFLHLKNENRPDTSHSILEHHHLVGKVLEDEYVVEIWDLLFAASKL